VLGVTVHVLAFSWYFYHDIHSTIETVHTRTAPAQLEAAAARAALAEADSLALKSFQSGEAQLDGPGDQYQNKIAMASQSLAQVAENNMAGETGSQQLQLVEGLLVAYTGWIEQADVYYRQDPASLLATTDLWYASRLLHAPDTGILAQLDALLKAQQEAMDNELAHGPNMFFRAVLLALPIAVLFVILLLAQRFLRRTFRRSVNVPLALSTVLLAVLCVLPVLNIVAQQRLATAAGNLRQVVDMWQVNTSAKAAEGQQLLKERVDKECPRGCSATVDRFTANLGNAGTNEPVEDKALTEKAQQFNEEITAVGATSGLEPLIPVGVVLLAVLVALGFRSRIEEYRYQPK
jgi:nitrate reductase gamma subunit